MFHPGGPQNAGTPGQLHRFPNINAMAPPSASAPSYQKKNGPIVKLLVVGAPKGVRTLKLVS
jgi:hypothetical protein